VLIAGGIAPKLAPVIEAGAFIRAFRDKGRMSPLLHDMRVSVILNPRVGLLGARRAAAALAAGAS
jgi:glucokinase